MKLVTNLLTSLLLSCHVVVWRIRYWNARRHLRRVFAKGTRPIRVAFLVSECAKWKVQSVYDMMNGDRRYEPFVVLTHADWDANLPIPVRQEHRENNIRFFKNRCIPFVETLVPDGSFKNHLRDFRPDIVFFQHPWTYHHEEMPGEVAEYALTCYVPYFTPNYGEIRNDSQLLFHRQLWCYFCLNELWASIFRNAKPWYKTAARFVAAGHPMLDCFNVTRSVANNGYVIYAPHWSFSYPGHDNFENYSTFPKNGQKILDYAKSHPEIKWVFKPHPTLKQMLQHSKIMTEDEIEAYWKDWESIGVSCYDGNYVDLFLQSRAMITDCASFLTEYPCTGHPLIHLCSSNRKIKTMEPSRRLFSTFYQAHNEDEMWHWFDEVLIKGRDPKKAERLAAVEGAGLHNTDAAKNILDYLNGEIYAD